MAVNGICFCCTGTWSVPVWSVPVAGGMKGLTESTALAASCVIIINMGVPPPPKLPD